MSDRAHRDDLGLVERPAIDPEPIGPHAAPAVVANTAAERAARASRGEPEEVAPVEQRQFAGDLPPPAERGGDGDAPAVSGDPDDALADTETRSLRELPPPRGEDAAAGTTWAAPARLDLAALPSDARGASWARGPVLDEARLPLLDDDDGAS